MFASVLTVTKCLGRSVSLASLGMLTSITAIFASQLNCTAKYFTKLKLINIFGLNTRGKYFSAGLNNGADFNEFLEMPDKTEIGEDAVLRKCAGILLSREKDKTLSVKILP